VITINKKAQLLKTKEERRNFSIDLFFFLKKLSNSRVYFLLGCLVCFYIFFFSIWWGFPAFFYNNLFDCWVMFFVDLFVYLCLCLPRIR